MASDRRLAALSRHLTDPANPTLTMQATSASTVCPKELYTFLTRDNMELRTAIFDFLKVGAHSLGIE
jgi:hypothetical protein